MSEEKYKVKFHFPYATVAKENLTWEQVLDYQQLLDSETNFLLPNTWSTGGSVYIRAKMVTYMEINKDSEWV